MAGIKKDYRGWRASRGQELYRIASWIIREGKPYVRRSDGVEGIRWGAAHVVIGGTGNVWIQWPTCCDHCHALPGIVADEIKGFVRGRCFEAGKSRPAFGRTENLISCFQKAHEPHSAHIQGRMA